ncbi:MAG: alpha-amylase family glycosyl hydrolase, partial [Treponema sp.]
GSFVPSDDVVKELGVTTSNSTATFKTWAPLASKVTLLLFTDSSSLTTPASTTEMTKGTSGVWSVAGVNISSYKYYKYRIVNNGTSYDVCDIWSKCASADSVASEIIDINSDSNATYAGAKDTSWGTQAGYYNPFGSTGTETKSYTDAVIYEMHIRDWSRVEVTDSTGKFLDIANGTKVIAHLKDLGVTHVQILPMFDYAQKNSDSTYNWGYNPYNYNVPEGRYVKDYTDGTKAVQDMRTMIAKLHEAGIAVNMDVVYNHTSGTGNGSLYDMTVPEYFYRVTDGAYSNGSGCGNEIATNHKMVEKFVINSLKYWMLDYHINGFRFDLMGCAEKSTMKNIYDALYEIDKNVMVYGEPWTGGTSAVVDGASSAVKGTSGIGAGAFDDSFRDAIKGAEFGGFKKGHVQGTFKDAAICTGLTGGSCTHNSTGDINLGLHYVECHDNYTLFDKLAMSYKNKTTYSGNLFTLIGTDGLATVKAEDKLAAAFVLLAQGTPFINGGQEFLRTKQGDENSYVSSDKINQIDLSMKDTYSDVYNTYKGLIALRKANPSAFGKNSSAAAATPVKGITKYTSGDFLVYFNATDSSYTIASADTTDYANFIDVSSGVVTTNTTLPTNVPARNFVIIKK